MVQSWRLACSVISMACVMSCAAEQTSDANLQASGDELDTPLLETAGEELNTTHSLKYAFSAADGFRLTPVNTRKDVFNGTPFLISRAAFIGNGAAAMIHAETVTDQSNASNYDNLPEATWPNSAFRSEGRACFKVSADEVEGEDDLQWLVQNGFSPVGTLMFHQAFLSSADYNDEIVVSLIQMVDSCDNNANEAAFERLQSAITVTAHQ